MTPIKLIILLGFIISCERWNQNELVLSSHHFFSRQPTWSVHVHCPSLRFDLIPISEYTNTYWRKKTPAAYKYCQNWTIDDWVSLVRLVKLVSGLTYSDFFSRLVFLYFAVFGRSRVISTLLVLLRSDEDVCCLSLSLLNMIDCMWFGFTCLEACWKRLVLEFVVNALSRSLSLSSLVNDRFEVHKKIDSIDGWLHQMLCLRINAFGFASPIYTIFLWI